MYMENNNFNIIFLILLSACFYVAPFIWVKNVTPATACISNFFALLTIITYAFCIKNHCISEINSDVFKKMMISGICYGLGLLFYTEAAKFNKPSLLTLQTIFIFILSTIMALTLLDSSFNKYKLIGIVTIIIGSSILVYHD